MLKRTTKMQWILSVSSIFHSSTGFILFLTLLSNTPWCFHSIHVPWNFLKILVLSKIIFSYSSKKVLLIGGWLSTFSKFVITYLCRMIAWLPQDLYNFWFVHVEMGPFPSTNFPFSSSPAFHQIIKNENSVLGLPWTSSS